MVEFIDFKSFIIENGQLISIILALLTALISFWEKLARVFRRIRKWFGYKKEPKVVLEEFELRVSHNPSFYYKTPLIKAYKFKPLRKLIKEIEFRVELNLTGQSNDKELTISVNSKGFIQFGKHTIGYILYKPKMIDATVVIRPQTDNYILFGRVGKDEIVYELRISEVFNQHRIKLKLTKYPKGYKWNLNEHNLFKTIPTLILE